MSDRHDTFVQDVHANPYPIYSHILGAPIKEDGRNFHYCYRDEKTPSFLVDKRDHKWADFGGDGRKNGPFDLIEMAYNLPKFADQVEEARKIMNIPQSSTTTKRNAPATTEAIMKNFAASVKRTTPAPAGEFNDNRTAPADVLPLVPLPSDVPALPMRHPTLGKPDVIWTLPGYCYEYRWNKSASRKKKICLPVFYFAQAHTHETTKNGKSVIEHHEAGWCFHGSADNLPPYGIEEVRSGSKKPVLIAEGPKTREGYLADPFYRNHIILAWYGGASRWNSTDWTDLANNPDVTLGPDADDAGRTAMDGLAKHLRGLNVLAKIVPTDGLPPGWDKADPLPDGMTEEDMQARFDAAQVVDIAPAPVEDVSNDSDQPREKFMPTPTVETCGINFPPRQWVIDGFMPPGTTLLFGLPKVGKTLFITKMLACLATGSAFLGYPVTKQDVLYIDGEDDQQGFQERLRLIGFPQGVPGMHEFCPADEWQFDEAGRAEIEAWLQNNPTVKTIVLDTLENLLPYPSAMQQGLHAQQRDVQRLKPVRRWADRLGVSVIVVHHPKKGQADGDFFSLCAGSNGIRGTVQTIMGIEPDKDSEELYMLRAQSRRMPALEVRLERKKGSVQWERAETVATLPLTDIQKEIKDYLEQFPHSKPALIAQVTGLNSATIRGTCSRMAREGLLGRSGKGEYFIPGFETPARMQEAVADDPGF